MAVSRCLTAGYFMVVRFGSLGSVLDSDSELGLDPCNRRRQEVSEGARETILECENYG